MDRVDSLEHGLVVEATRMTGADKDVGRTALTDVTLDWHSSTSKKGTHLGVPLSIILSHYYPSGSGGGPELIAHARNGNNVPWVFGVGFDFLPQTPDEDA